MFHAADQSHPPELGFYSRDQVIALTTLSHVTLWRRIAAGEFPRSVQLSPNRVGWPRQAVNDWLQKRSAGSGRPSEP